MKESIFMDRIKDVFAILDRGVYKAISILYDTIEQLATTSIFSSISLDDIATKIYGLIALFMIFKISFSLINFLVNPDQISDKAKGGGALIKNIIITFVLIIVVPFGFDLLYRAQKAIISDGIVEKYILGGNTEEAGYSITMDDKWCEGIEAHTSRVGDYIGLMAFKPLFQVFDEEITDNSVDWEQIKEQYCMADTRKNEGQASVANLLRSNDVYSSPHGMSTEKYYTIEYTFFLPTAIGIVIAILFLGFCFDVAVRAVKLQFLELIAPVPIISYIDPDSSKNGMFKKWLKEVFNTWLSLFIRLAAIYFAIYIIGLLANADFPDDNLWIKLLIIIGALIFAKQLPKTLEEILGIKTGKMQLNPIKRLNDEALGFKALTGFAGGAVAAGLGVGDAIKNGSGNRFKDIATNISKGYSGGSKNPIKGMTSGMTYSNKMRNERHDARRNIAETNDFLRKGKEFYDRSLVQKNDGSFDSNPTKLFANEEYRNSFNKVETMKKAKNDADKAYDKASIEYQAAVNRGAPKEEQDKLEAVAASAKKTLAGAQSRFDYAKEQHKSMQNIYTKDAEVERAIDAFKKTNPDYVDKSKEPRHTSPSSDNIKTSSGRSEKEEKNFEGYVQQYNVDDAPPQNVIGDAAVETNYGNTDAARKDDTVYDMNMYGDVLSQPTMVNGVPYVNGKPIKKINKRG